MGNFIPTANERAVAKRGGEVLRELHIGKSTGWRINTVTWENGTGPVVTDDRVGAAYFDPIQKLFYVHTTEVGPPIVAKILVYNEDGNLIKTIDNSSENHGATPLAWMHKDTVDNTVIFMPESYSTNCPPGSVLKNTTRSFFGTPVSGILTYDSIIDNDLRKVFQVVYDTAPKVIQYDISRGMARTNLYSLAVTDQTAIRKLASGRELSFILENNHANAGITKLYVFPRGYFADGPMFTFDETTIKIAPPTVYGTDWYDGTNSILNQFTRDIKVFDNKLIITNWESGAKFGFYIIDLDKLEFAAGSYISEFVTLNEDASLKPPQYDGIKNTASTIGTQLWDLPIHYDGSEHVLSYAYRTALIGGYYQQGFYHYNFISETGYTQLLSGDENTTGLNFDHLQRVDSDRYVIVSNDTNSYPSVGMYTKTAYSDITKRVLDFGTGSHKATQPPDDTQFVFSNINIMLKNEDGYYDFDDSRSYWRTNSIDSPVGTPIRLRISRHLPDGTWTAKRTIYNYQMIDFPEIDGSGKTASFQLAPMSYGFNSQSAINCGQLCVETWPVVSDSFTVTNGDIIPGTVTAFLYDGSSYERFYIFQNQTTSLARAKTLYYNASTGVFNIERTGQGYTNAYIIYRIPWTYRTPDFLANRLLDVGEYYDRNIEKSNIVITDSDEVNISLDGIIDIGDGVTPNKYIIPGPDGGGYFWVLLTHNEGGNNDITEFYKFYTSNKTLVLVSTATIQGKIFAGASNKITGAGEILCGIFFTDYSTHSGDQPGIWRYSVSSDAVSLKYGTTGESDSIFGIRNCYHTHNAFDQVYNEDNRGRVYIANYSGVECMLYSQFNESTSVPGICAIPTSYAGFIAANETNIDYISTGDAVNTDNRSVATAQIKLFSPGGENGGWASNSIVFSVCDPFNSANAIIEVYKYYFGSNTTTKIIDVNWTLDDVEGLRVSISEFYGPNTDSFIMLISGLYESPVYDFKPALYIYKNPGSLDPVDDLINIYYSSTSVPLDGSFTKFPRGTCCFGDYIYIVNGSNISTSGYASGTEGPGLGTVSRIPLGNFTGLVAADLAATFNMRGDNTGTDSNMIVQNGKLYFIGYPTNEIFSIGVNNNIRMTSFDTSGQTIFSALSMLAVDSHSTFYTDMIGRFNFVPKLRDSPESASTVEFFNDTVGAVSGNMPKITNIYEMANSLTGTYADGAAVEVYPPENSANESARLFGKKNLNIDFTGLSSAQDGALVRAILGNYYRKLNWPKIRIRFTCPFMEWVELKDLIGFYFLSIMRLGYNLGATVEAIDYDFNKMEMALEIMREKPKEYPTSNEVRVDGGYTIITSAESIGANVSTTVTSTAGFAAGDYVFVYTSWYSFFTTVVSVTNSTELVLTDILSPVGANDKARLVLLGRSPAWDIDFTWDVSGWDYETV